MRYSNDRASADCEQMNRVVNAGIGQHHFTFYMVSTPTNDQQESVLFESALQSFISTRSL